MDRISVIVPCYNVEKYIDRCMSSIVSQSVGIDSMEVIVINDCSTDNTLSLLRGWENKYSEYIVLIDCEENIGLGAARNLGLQYATGTYVSFIDSDDWIEPDYLEILSKKAQVGDYDVVACNHKRDDSGELSYLSEKERGIVGSGVEYNIDCLDARKTFFVQQPLKLYAWGKIVRRSLLEKYGIMFPESLAYEDVIWGNNLYMYAEKCYVLDCKLYHYYINENSLVLKKASMHHIDHFTINELLWKDWIERGFFEKYQEELIYEYYFDAYLATLKILVYRFEEAPYSLFRLLQEMIKDKIPESVFCKYRIDGTVSEFHNMLIDLVYKDIDKEQFLLLTERIKDIGL